MVEAVAPKPGLERHFHSHEGSDHRPGGIKARQTPLQRISASRFSVGSGVNRILVLRIDFANSDTVDENGREVDTFTVGSAPNAYDFVKGQVEKYFNEQSRGKHRVELTFPAMSLIGSNKLTGTHTFYGLNKDTQIEAATHAVLSYYEPHVNYALYDSVIIMHAGTGQEVLTSNTAQGPLIHSFRSTFSAPYVSPDGVNVYSYVWLPEHYANDVRQTVGVIVHEYGHELGLPDLYDTSTSSPHAGVGNWCVMAGGSYGGPNSDGTVPAGFSAWARIFLGWEEPELVTEGTIDAKPPGLQGKIYKIWADGPTKPHEYFLLENRFNGDLGNGITNWDQYLPLGNPTGQTGIVIYHVDESIGTVLHDTSFNKWDFNNIQSDASHKYLDVEEATTTQHLDANEGQSGIDDTWKNDSAVAFNNVSELSKPYSGGNNGLSLTFQTAAQSSMSVQVSQGIHLLAVDSSTSGVLDFTFSREIMNSPGNSVMTPTPGLGNLTASKLSANVLRVTYSGTINRQQQYSVTFSNFTDVSGNAYSATIPNAFGTTINRYNSRGREIWTEDKSPYVIDQADFLVNSTTQLILQSGTVMQLGSKRYIDSSTSFPSRKLDLIVYGQVQALGTPSKPVIIQSTATVAATTSSWGQIFVASNQDKPSIFRHTRIESGDTCVYFRDNTQHLILHSTFYNCDIALRTGTTFPSGGSIPDGGANPKMYHSVIDSVRSGVVMDSGSAKQTLFMNTFHRNREIAVHYQAASKSPLENIKYNQISDVKDHNVFALANTGTDLGLSRDDLKEFHTTARSDNNLIVQFVPDQNGSFETSTLTHKVSTDWQISTMQLLASSSSTVLSRVFFGQSFRVQAVASSATNNNSEKKRVLGVEVGVNSKEQPVLITLEETTADSKTFLSQAVSTWSSGFSTSGRLSVNTTDTIYIRSLDSGFKLVTVPVGITSTTNQTPSLSLSSLTTSGNSVLLALSLVDANSDSLSVAFEYSLNGGTSFTTTTNLSRSLSSLTPTTSLTFTWLSSQDFQSDQTNVRIRLTPNDGTANGDSVLSSVFTLLNRTNTAPVLSNLLLDSTSSSVRLTFGLADAQNDSSTVLFEYSTNAGQSWTASNNVTPGLTALTPGASKSFLWNSSQDISTNETQVRLRLTPNDGRSAGDSVQSTVFALLNRANTAPSISSLNVASGSGVIPFSFTLTDAQTDAINLSFEYSVDNGGSFTASALVTPSLSNLTPNTTVTLFWSSSSLIQSNQTSVRIRLTPRDYALTGDSVLSSQFAVSNQANRVPILSNVAFEGTSGVVQFHARPTDPDGDRVSLSLEYRSGSAQNYTTSSNVTPALTSIASGVFQTFAWNSYADLPLETGVEVQLRACDASLCSTAAVAGLTMVYNQVRIASAQVNYSSNVALVSYNLSVPQGAQVTAVNAIYSIPGTSVRTAARFLPTTTSTGANGPLTWIPFREFHLTQYNSTVQLELIPSLASSGASTGAITTFSFEAQAVTTSLTYNFKEGWNFFSFYPSENTSYSDFFSQFASNLTSCAFTYELSSFRHYCPTTSLASTASLTSVTLTGTMTNGMGFWLKSSQDFSVSLTSELRLNRRIQLGHGWNLKSIYYTEATTPTHLDTRLKFFVDFSGGEQGIYRGSYATQGVTNTRIQTAIPNYSFQDALWIYSENATVVSPYSLK